MSMLLKRSVVGLAGSAVAVAGLAVAQAPDSRADQSAPSSLPRRAAAVQVVEAPVSGSPEAVAAAGAQRLLGLSADDAVQFLQAQRAFGSVVDDLRGRLSEFVSGYRWNYEENRGEITLVESADQAGKDAVSRLAGSVGALVLDGGEISREARAEQSVQLSEYIREAHPEITNLRVHPAQDYASLEVESPVEVSDEVAAWASSQKPVVKVSVLLAPTMGGSLSGGVSGGAQLNNTNGNADCTSGFTIQRGGVRYLLTAAHCNNYLNYGNNAWLIFVASRQGSYGDMQYHQIYNGGVALPKFQYTAGSLTTNRYPSWPYPGELVNRYGRVTSESILVENDDSQETIGSVTYTHMAVTDGGTNNQMTDSGGPFWVGATGGAAAEGTLTGSVWVNPLYKHAVFTPAGNLWLIWSDASYYTA